MNREKKIEQAAFAWHDATCAEGPDCRSRMLLHGDPLRPVIGPLTAVVDALLPQVSTVEELEALRGDDVWLASGGVHPSKALRRALYWTGYDFAAFGPLTVVWQP